MEKGINHRLLAVPCLQVYVCVWCMYACSTPHQHACVRAYMRAVLTCMLTMLTHWGCVCVWCVFACSTHFQVSTFGLPFPSHENLIDSNSLIRRVGVTVIVTSGATVNQTSVNQTSVNQTNCQSNKCQSNKCQSNKLSIKHTVNQTN